MTIRIEKLSNALAAKDVAALDNRCTLHCALNDFEHTSPRHRVRRAVPGTPLGRVTEESATS
jgi:taurine dioxygenase